MDNPNLVRRSFLNSLAATAYIAAVALFMFNGEKILGAKEDNFLMPLSMLLLFVLSASVVSGLILGKPILLYLDGEKKEGIRMFIQSVFWLFIFAIAAFVSILLV